MSCRLAQVFSLALVLSACGRIGYDVHERDAEVDALPAIDAASDAAQDASVDASDMAMSLAAVVVAPTAGLTTTEGGERAMFSVVLATAPSANVTLAFSSSDTTEGTVSPPVLAFSPLNWNAPQIVHVTGVNDSDADGDTEFTIVSAPAVSSDAEYNGIDPSDVTVTNIDDETAGVSVLPTSGLSTTESGTTATFTITLHSAPSGDVAVALSSSATDEVTVSPPSVTFTSTNWSAGQTVTVTGVDDSDLDGAQPFTVVTAPCVSADPNYGGLDPDDVTGTNRDNESGGIVVAADPGLFTTEAGGTATFTVALLSAPTSDVMIPVASTDATEGTVDSPALVFTSSNWNVPRVVTVTGVDDGLADGDQVYAVHLGPSVSADDQYNALSASDVLLTNTDDDVPGVAVSPASGLTTTEAGDTDTFDVVLRSRPSSDVTIDLSSSDTGELTVSPSSFVFSMANWDVPQTATVTGVDDAIVDGDQIVDVTVHVSASGDAGYLALSDTVLAITNVDDETPSVIVTPTSGLTTTEAGATATFTMRLGSLPSASVLISLASDTVSEGTVSPSVVSFSTANWNVPRTITVTGVNDAYDDGNRAYHIVTDAAVSADVNYSGLDPSDVTVTNTDDDNAAITVTPTSGLVTTEAGGSATFTVILTSQPTDNLTIALSTSDASEGDVSPAFLTFSGYNWNTLHTVTVTGLDDDVDDGDVMYSIVTAAPTSADMTYSAINPADVTVTNTDNDAAGVVVTPTSGLVTYEGSGATADFSIVLSSEPTADVTVALSSSNAAEGTVSPLSVTFTALNWNIPQFVSATGVDDFVMDGNTMYNIVTGSAVSADPVYNGVAVADVSVTNIDNDALGISVSPIAGLVTNETGTTATFSIRLNTLPTASVTIGLTSSNVGEGTVSPASVTFTTGNWSMPQTVTITGVDDVLPDGNVMYSIITAAAVSADTNYNGINPSDVSVVNYNDDIASVTVSPTSGLVTNENGQTATFTIVLGRAPAANVTIDLDVTLPGEAKVVPDTITFKPLNWNVPQTVTLTGLDDYQRDFARAYSVVTSACTSADPVYSGFAVDDVSVANNDNELAFFYVGYLALTIDVIGGTPWVVSYGDHSLEKINPATNAVISTTPLGAGAQGLAYDGSRLWIPEADIDRVSLVNPATAGVVGTMPVGDGPVSALYAGGSIWVANGLASTAQRINPLTQASIASVPIPAGASGLGSDGTNLWVAGGQGGGQVAKVDMGTNAVTATVPIGGTPRSVEFAAGSIWVSRSTGTQVARVNPTTNIVEANITVGYGSYGMVYDGSRLWVAVTGTNGVAAIDPATNTVTRTLAAAATPTDVAWDGSSLWVASYGLNSVQRIVP